MMTSPGAGSNSAATTNEASLAQLVNDLDIENSVKAQGMKG